MTGLPSSISVCALPPDPTQPADEPVGRYRVVRRCPGIPLEDPSIPPGGPVGRLACLVSPSIQPGGARVPQASTQRLGPGPHPDGLSRTRICLSEGQRPLCEHHQTAERVKPTESKAQRKDHPMQQPRPILLNQRPARPTSPAHNAIAHRTLSTPHARATSCPMSTCRQVEPLLDLNRSALARIDRRLVTGLGNVGSYWMVRVPVTEATASDMALPLRSVGGIAGRGTAELIAYGFGAGPSGPSHASAALFWLGGAVWVV